MADTELEDSLEEAKNGPRNYAIIYKGSTIVKMIVQKKRIREGDIQYAKRTYGGNASIEGVCSRQGAELTLQVLSEEPALKPMKVKEFIALETGFPMRPQWQVVTKLIELDDEGAIVRRDQVVKPMPSAPPPSTAEERKQPPAAPSAPDVETTKEPLGTGSKDSGASGESFSDEAGQALLDAKGPELREAATDRETPLRRETQDETPL